MISSSKLSLSMKDAENKESSRVDSPRTYASRRFGDGQSQAKSNPFNTISPSATKSPSTNASSAFGLGTGAFASFGSNKPPKTPGSSTGFDFTSREKREKEKDSGSETTAEKLETDA